MPWVKLDAGFPNHPKVVAAGWKAGWLYVCGLTYCSQYLTDGRIPKAQVKRLSDIPRPEVEAERLVCSGLWVDDGADYVVHDYTVWQTPAEKVDRMREEGKKRAKASYEERAKKRRAFAKSSREESSPDVDVDVEASSSSESDSRRTPRTGADEEEEEGDAALREAMRRLALTPSAIVDPKAWVNATAQRLRNEGWTPEMAPQAKPVAEPPRCDTCKDVALDEPCPDCDNEARSA